MHNFNRIFSLIVFIFIIASCYYSDDNNAVNKLWCNGYWLKAGMFMQSLWDLLIDFSGHNDFNFFVYG